MKESQRAYESGRKRLDFQKDFANAKVPTGTKMKKHIIRSKIILFALLPLLVLALTAPAVLKASAEGERKEYMILSGDDRNGVSDSNPDLGNKIEGQGSLVNDGKTPVFVAVLKGFDRISENIDYDDAYLEFYIQVDKPEFLVGDSQFELNDSGKVNDNKEVSWSMQTVNTMLKPGWNYVCLKFTSASKSEDVEYSKLNFMRLYFSTPQKDRDPNEEMRATVRIDAVKVVSAPLNLAPSDIVPKGADGKIINYIVNPDVARQGKTPLAFTLTISLLSAAFFAACLTAAVILLKKNGLLFSKNDVPAQARGGEPVPQADEEGKEGNE